MRVHSLGDIQIGRVRLDKKRGGTTGLFLLGVFVILGLLAASVMAAWPFTTDDAYIPLRYASNLAHHGQLNWNLDDPVRVEGYSSSLYMALAFLAIKLSCPPILALKLFSLAALVASILLTYGLTSRFSNRWYGLSAAAFFGGYFGTVWWAVSGLETTLYVLLVLLSFKLYLAALEAPPVAAGRLLALLGTTIAVLGITRPEGPVLGIVLAFSIAMRGLMTGKALRAIAGDLLRLAAPFVAIYGAFFVVRYAHFHEIWPNTYYFKTALSDRPFYLLKMFISVAAYPLVFGLLGLIDKAKRRFLVPAYSYMILLVVLLYGVNPVIATHNRHASPALALTAIAFALALYEARRYKPFVSEALALYLTLGQLTMAAGNIPELRRQAGHYQERNAARFQVAEWIADHGIRAYALGDAGIIPYATPGTSVYDYYGLNSKAMTSAIRADGTNPSFQWLLDLRPEAVIVMSRFRHAFKPRNMVGRLLQEHFTPGSGYADAGISFGGPTDAYYYRILLRVDR